MVDTKELKELNKLKLRIRELEDKVLVLETRLEERSKHPTYYPYTPHYIPRYLDPPIWIDTPTNPEPLLPGNTWTSFTTKNSDDIPPLIQ